MFFLFFLGKSNVHIVLMFILLQKYWIMDYIGHSHLVQISLGVSKLSQVEMAFLARK